MVQSVEKLVGMQMIVQNMYRKITFLILLLYIMVVPDPIYNILLEIIASSVSYK